MDISSPRKVAWTSPRFSPGVRTIRRANEWLSRPPGSPGFRPRHLRDARPFGDRPRRCWVHVRQFGRRTGQARLHFGLLLLECDHPSLGRLVHAVFVGCHVAFDGPLDRERATIRVSPGRDSRDCGGSAPRGNLAPFRRQPPRTPTEGFSCTPSRPTITTTYRQRRFAGRLRYDFSYRRIGH